MVDVISVEDLSVLMGKIRSYGDKSTEFKLMGIFKANGITEWRRKQDLVGKPDFVFRRLRVCIFVDGCFWHGCPKCCRLPSSNQAYWSTKIERNRVRERLVVRTPKALGRTVLRISEHQLVEGGQGRLLARLRRSLSPS